MSSNQNLINTISGPADMEAAARAENWGGSIHQWARLGKKQGRDWWEPRLAEIEKDYPATGALIRRLMESR